VLVVKEAAVPDVAVELLYTVYVLVVKEAAEPAVTDGL
jgi:hypothetical protein